MKSIVIAVAALTAALAVSSAASAAGHPTTGAQIRLLNPAATPTTFASNTAFFVRHGFICTPLERAACLDPNTEFRLYVDGERMPSMLDLRPHITCETESGTSYDCVGRGHLTNVASGLPQGLHAFRGEWWAAGELLIMREATIDFVG